MKYIVLDMEWNQPFNFRRMIHKPVSLYGEIIQIGAVKLDENFSIQDTFKIMVAPRYYTKMNSKVTKVTKITTEELQYGFPFSVAFKHFKKWCGEDFTFLTWGCDDIGILRDNLLLHNEDVEWLPKTYDVQKIFDIQVAKEKRQISLADAMARVGEELLDAHDALNDAKNTVRICNHLDMAEGILEIETRRGQNAKSSAVQKCRIEKRYESKETAFGDSGVVEFLCPLCGKSVRCDVIVKQNSTKYISIGKCVDGEEWFVRFKFSKGIDGKLDVSRIVYELDDDNMNFYQNKEQEAAEAEAAHLLWLSMAG